MHDNQEPDHEYLRANAAMLANASNSHSNPPQNTGELVDESLSWQQVFQTTMTDAEYQHSLTNASADQIDKVFCHNRSRIVASSADFL